ncbi:MAG: hypothetical protein RR048_03825 [Oscillospiraceae bacterium]
MDKNKFDKIINNYRNERDTTNSIGTLGEKSLHNILKNYLQEDKSKHEIKIGRHVADIFDGEKITEIQTRDFYPLNKKLDAFLPQYKVEIVFPVAFDKYVCWIDTENGELTKKRKSPKNATICEILPQIYKLRKHMFNENLSFRIVSIGAEEYRLLDGWSYDKKRGSHRFELVPTRLFDEITISNSSDYKRFLFGLDMEEFTSKDFSRFSKLSPAKARTALLVLTRFGAVVRTGKKGNTIIYKKA